MLSQPKQTPLPGRTNQGIWLLQYAQMPRHHELILSCHVNNQQFGDLMEDCQSIKLLGKSYNTIGIETVSYLGIKTIVRLAGKVSLTIHSWFGIKRHNSAIIHHPSFP